MSPDEDAPDRPDVGPPPADHSIVPPPADYQTPPVGDGERPPVPPGWRPEAGVAERPLRREPKRPHPNFGWSCLWCLLFVFATQIPGAVIAAFIVIGVAVVAPERFPKGALADQAGLIKSEPMGVALAVAFFFTELLVIGFSWLVIRLVVGRDWTRQLALRRPTLSHSLLTLASLPGLVLLGNVAYEILRKVFHVPSLSDYGLSGMEEMVEIFSQWPWGFAVLVIGLGPGIGEELWCRGFLGRGLVGNYGAVVGVLATSFFFGAIHVDPCQGTMAMLMGLWLHFVYLTTRSLFLPMLLHFLNNSLAVVASRLPGKEFLDAKPSDIPVLVYLAAAVLLAAVAYALYQSRARIAAEESGEMLVSGRYSAPGGVTTGRIAADDPGTMLLWEPEYPGVEYPPPDSGARVVHPAPSPAATALATGAFLLFVAACVGWVRAG